MKKRKLLFTMLALGLGAFSGGSGAMAQSTNNGWNAILSQTQTQSDDWTAITSNSTTGLTLGATGTTTYYYVTGNRNFSNTNAGGSGLKIQGTVYLYLPTGLSITCVGANASGTTGAGAGIELASGNTLYIIGGTGTVNATGGNAANGSNGLNGGDASWSNDSYTYVGNGGAGGNGGGGAGAGIGTRGGDGGAGGAGGAGHNASGDYWENTNAVDGSAGGTGGTGGAMGSLYVANGITVNAVGGNYEGLSAGSPGNYGSSYIADEDSYNYAMSGGAGGAGGGFGGAAANIGTGGPGGGGGGGGSSGSRKWSGTNYFRVGCNGGYGGYNGGLNSKASNASDYTMTGTQYYNGTSYSDRGKEYDTDYMGSGGASGNGGNGASAGGTDNTLKNLEYTITYHWLLPSVTTTTVKYNPSTGASVVLPQNSQDGYQWALGVYGKDCHVSGDASEFTTASKEFYGGNFDATANRTIYLKDVYGNLDFYEVKSVCMLKNSGSNTQEISDFFVADNNPHANAPKWPITVRLQDRTIYKDDYWNTICLPFSMTKDQFAASPLASATVKKLNTSVSGYYPSGYVNKVGTQQFDYGYPVLLFWFEDVDINGSGNVIEAGKPYLVKWASGDHLVDDTSEPEGATTLHQLDFNYMTVKATSPGSWVSEATTNGSVTFAGTFSSEQLTGGDNRKLILGPQNKLYYPSSTLSVAACRGYFIIPQAAANLLSTANAPQIVMGFDDGETTSIQVVNGSGLKNQSSDTYYNLNGQRLSAPKKGINIVNGKKVVIK